MASIDEYISILKSGRILNINQLSSMLKLAKEVLANEQNVVMVRAPVTVVGDIHGQLFDLLEIFRISGDLPSTNYLFMGDYVDRGNYSIECFSLVLALKIKYKEKITVLRGNHESCEINKIYGFYDECMKKYGSEKVWKLIYKSFLSKQSSNSSNSFTLNVKFQSI